MYCMFDLILGFTIVCLILDFGDKHINSQNISILPKQAQANTIKSALLM